MNEERYRKLKASAQRYTAYRERSPKEVTDKLAEWDSPPEIIEQILKELQEDNFIDEERFARAFCHDKFLVNKWGKRRISLELGRYGVSEEAKKQGLDYIKQSEYHKTLTHLTEQKWSKVKDTEVFKKKQKTVAFLVQKGYEPELIWEVINKL